MSPPAPILRFLLPFNPITPFEFTLSGRIQSPLAPAARLLSLHSFSNRFGPKFPKLPDIMFYLRMQILILKTSYDTENAAEYFGRICLLR